MAAGANGMVSLPVSPPPASTTGILCQTDIAFRRSIFKFAGFGERRSAPAPVLKKSKPYRKYKKFLRDIAI
jgi:hypothetical protein